MEELRNAIIEVLKYSNSLNIWEIINCICGMGIDFANSSLYVAIHELCVEGVVVMVPNDHHTHNYFLA